MKSSVFACCLPAIALLNATGLVAESLEETFFKDPIVVDVTLSPDGAFIGGIGYFKGERYLQTMRVNDGEIFSRRTLKGTQVGNYAWVDSDTLLFGLFGSGQPVWDLNPEALSVFQTDVQMRNPRPVFIEHGSLTGEKGKPEPVYVFDPLPHVPSQVILSSNFERERTLYLHDLKSGKRTAIETAKLGEGRYFWLLDPKNNPVVRGFDRYSDPELMRFEYRTSPEQEWQPFPSQRFGDPRLLHPNPRLLITQYRSGPPDSAYFVDLQTSDAFGDPVRDDFFAVIPRPIHYNLSSISLGFSYHTDRKQAVWFDPNYQRVHELLSAKYPDMDVSIAGFVPKGALIVFSLTSDIQPTIFKAYQTQTGLVTDLPFLDQRPDIQPEDNSPTQSIFFDARDGQKIHAYLTVPKGGEAPHPLIMILHGGPAARDYWGYDPEVQYFARLGFAVLQVNFRGSSGFGYDFAGGDSIQHAVTFAAKDSVDGVRSLIADGIVDPERIGVYGWSFGGFAAMMCAAEAPDLFRFVISCAGVYDYAEHIAADRRRFPGAGWVSLRYGDFDGVDEFYRSHSPIAHAEQIGAKVLMYQGGNDHRIENRQFRAMSSALKAAGNTPETITNAWGEHGINLSADRIKFYRQVRRFIETSLRDDGRGNMRR